MLKKRSILLLALGLGLQANAQQPGGEAVKYYQYTPEEYGRLKETGKLPTDGVPVVVMSRDGSSHAQVAPAPNERSTCGCYQEPDPTYTLAMPPNDDGSTGVIALPFTFCFYGTNYTSLYINNNGNVSFGAPYATFSAVGFPSASYVMIAPFWGDVDTRTGLGQVVYKIYPNAIYINWDNVGYYSIHGDKRNSFQLILSDGTDPIAGVGNNVAFCYKDMQWTTGDASSGVGGFGGVPATVGANKGDGVNYIQFGRFDQAGTAYDGPFGNPDGVSWLDYQSLKFDVCVTNNNVSPVFSDFQPGGLSGSGSGCGDTIKICDIGDTLIFSAQAIDPNAGDIVTLTASAPGVTGFSVLSSTPGNPANIYMQLITSALNVGYNYITVTATDNGSPPANSALTFWVFVDTTGISNFNPSITGDTLLCPGETTILDVGSGYGSYDWSTGSAIQTSGTISAAGTYYVTVSQNNCYKTVFQDVYVFPEPQPNIYGNLSFCMGSTTNLSTDTFYTSYSWVNNAVTISTTSSATASAGTVTLTVTDTNTCVGDTTVNVTIGISMTINGNPNGCSDDTIMLYGTSPNGPGTYVWSNGTNNDTTIALTSGYLSVTYTDSSGCTLTDSVLVTITPNPVPTITGDTSLCMGETTVLDAGTGYSAYSWSNGNNTQLTTPISTAGNYMVTVTQNGCTGSDTVTVVVHPLPTPVINGNLNICNGNNTILTTGAFTSYNWSLNGNNVSATSSATVGPGNVVLTVTDGFGCVDSTSATVTSTAPSVSISGIPAACQGVPITLTANSPNGPGTYSWSNGSGTNTTTVNNTGTYIVTFTDAGGCSNTDTFTVSFYPVPNAAFSASPDTALDVVTVTQFNDLSTIASPGNIVSWTWIMSDTSTYNTQNPSHNFDHYGTYLVTLIVTSADGCTDTVTHEYWVVPPIVVPNVFSPGGSSGVNDFLVFTNLEFFGPATLQVFNRWGTLLYESSNYRNDWDGKFNGKYVSDGTYFYILVLNNGKTYHVPLTIFVK